MFCLFFSNLTIFHTFKLFNRPSSYRFFMIWSTKDQTTNETQTPVAPSSCRGRNSIHILIYKDSGIKCSFRLSKADRSERTAQPGIYIYNSNPSSDNTASRINVRSAVVKHDEQYILIFLTSREPIDQAVKNIFLLSEDFSYLPEHWNTAMRILKD